MPYRLVPPLPGSIDVITALKQLLEAAQSGHITGIAVVCAMRRSRYITEVAGTCISNATLTRGMIAHLDDELSDLSHDRHEDDTR